LGTATAVTVGMRWRELNRSYERSLKPFVRRRRQVLPGAKPTKSLRD